MLPEQRQDRGYSSNYSQIMTAAHLSRESTETTKKRLLDKPSKKPRLSDEEATEVWFAVGGFMLCSALMLIVNKLAVKNFPVPSFVIFSQLFFTAFAVWMAACAFGMVEIDGFVVSKIKWFGVVAITFVCLLFSNMKTLQYCNVETFIVFRASTPILVCIGDYLFLGRELPGGRSVLCLIGMVIGASLYVYTDGHFILTGYQWVGLWYILFVFDQLFIKKVTSHVKVKSNWSRVFYTNFLSSLPLIFVWPFELGSYVYGGDESADFMSAAQSKLTVWSFVFWSLSCFLAIAISYFAFLARAKLSATSFTIVGNVCKVLTVTINYVMWEYHANWQGLIGLGICLFCGYFYKQAGMRKVKGHDEPPDVPV